MTTFTSTEIFMEISITTVDLGDGVTSIRGEPITVTVVDGGTGPQGPPGASAPLPLAYSVVAVSLWSQAHSFGYLPEVRLIDPTGSAVAIGAQYPDANTVFLLFPTPFTGTIILS
jgi:hypothetical protein